MRLPTRERGDRAGYGLALAEAQHTVGELANDLKKRGVMANSAISSVAAACRAHEVLLAERTCITPAARMDQVNGEFPQTTSCS